MPSPFLIFLLNTIAKNVIEEILKTGWALQKNT